MAAPAAAPVVAGAARGGAAGGAGSAAGAGAGGAGGGAGGAAAGGGPEAGGGGLVPDYVPAGWPGGGDEQEDGGGGAGIWIAAAAVGFLRLLLLIVLLCAIPIMLIAGIVTAITGGTGEQRELICVGAGCGIPPAAQPFVAMYTDAAKVYKVNPYLLMAVHEDESDFGTSTARGVTNYLNFVGCCAGPMQFLITGGSLNTIGGRGGTWAGYADAYKKATIKRPVSYPNQYAPHPNVYDSFDSIYAAAKYFSSLGAGPKLDHRTLAALVRYKGTPPASVPYARRDYERAQELERAGGLIPSDATRLQRVIAHANRVDSMNIPYCWAGGHAAKPGPSYIVNDCWREGRQQYGRSYTDTGLDCSGSVRWLLVLAGYPDPGPTHSSQFASKYPRGQGEHVTIWSNNGHVFMTIEGRDWGTSRSNFAHGPGWASHPKAGFVASHPPGL